jgi:hypothetical protein
MADFWLSKIDLISPFVLAQKELKIRLKSSKELFRISCNSTAVLLLLLKVLTVANLAVLEFLLSVDSSC